MATRQTIVFRECRRHSSPTHHEQIPTGQCNSIARRGLIGLSHASADDRPPSTDYTCHRNVSGQRQSEPTWCDEVAWTAQWSVLNSVGFQRWCLSRCVWLRFRQWMGCSKGQQEWRLNSHAACLSLMALQSAAIRPGLVVGRHCTSSQKSTTSGSMACACSTTASFKIT